MSGFLFPGNRRQEGQREKAVTHQIRPERDNVQTELLPKLLMNGIIQVGGFVHGGISLSTTHFTIYFALRGFSDSV